MYISHRTKQSYFWAVGWLYSGEFHAFFFLYSMCTETNVNKTFMKAKMTPIPNYYVPHGFIAFSYLHYKYFCSDDLFLSWSCP